MWTRLELKEQGRQDFKSDYWAYVLVAFIAVLCTGEHLTFITQQLDIHSYSISTIGTLLSILLLHPLYIGTRRFFLSTNLPVLTSKASLDFLFMIITITTTAIAIPAMTAITMIIGFVPFESFSSFSA